MRRVAFALSILIAASGLMASDGIFELSGWAEIPSSYRQPGPTSGQFQFVPPATVNGVTPPYINGQPIPGFSGIIPSAAPGVFIGLPDNGYGSQGNSADYVLGFYEFTPHFKTIGDGTTSRGSVTVHSFTLFSDPSGYLLNAAPPFITGGPVYSRTNYYPLPAT